MRSWQPPGASARSRARARRAGRAAAGVAVAVALTMSAAVAAGASTHPAGNAGGHPRPSARPVIHATLTAPRSAKPPANAPRVPRTVALPYRHAPSRQALARQSLLNTTIPTFSSSVVAGQNGNTYGFTIVGQNPFAGSAGTTSFPVQVIPVIVTDGSSGDVYDPTTANAGCGEPVSPITGMLTGPLLTRHRWYAGGTYIGTDQYIGAQMREEFWQYANRSGVSPGYHVRFNGSEPAVVSVTFNGGTEVNAGTCNELEEFPLSTWDSYVQGTLIPELASFGVSSTTFPFFLFKNVVFTSNGCCVLGYHSAFNSGGNTQTYGNGDYVTDGEFGSIADMAVDAHEMGEWANDPFVNNPTPPWGHLGQQPNCQGNLEVGDPLTGTDFAVRPPRPGGVTYHLQELAFFGWFYADNIGVHGWYSSRGTFTSPSTLCS
jgi:hypothetical protein